MLIFSACGSRMSSAKSDLLSSLKIRSSIIEQEEFESNVDVASWLEEDESIDDMLREDPDSVFYKIKIDNQDVYGFYQCGIDTLFTENGTDLLEKAASSPSITHQKESNEPLSWLLHPIGSVEASSRMGIEKERFKTEKLTCIDGSNGSTRMQILINDKAVCGIQVTNNVIDNLFTDANFRRRGLALKLFDYAKSLYPDLQHSTSRTPDGELFIKSIDKYDSNTIFKGPNT